MDKLSDENLRVFVAIKEDDLEFALDKSFKENNVTFIVRCRDYQQAKNSDKIINDWIKSSQRDFNFKLIKSKEGKYEVCLSMFEDHTIFILPEEPEFLSRALSSVVIGFVLREYLVKRRFVSKCRFKLEKFKPVNFVESL